MQLVEAFVRNPIKVAVGVLMVSLFGAIALNRMPMQLTPEVETPTITIETKWIGASPQEIEREIVTEQEEQLKGVEGVTKMSSESADSQGTIKLEFRVGTNMDEALLKVNSRLSQVPDYPDDSDQPVLSTANSSDSPIAWFILSARPPSNDEIDAFVKENPETEEALSKVRSARNAGLRMLRLRRAAEEYPAIAALLPPPDMDVAKLQRFAEDEIEARFERVPGVSQSNVIGGLEDELQVVVDPEKLAVRQVTLADVRRVLQTQNQDTSAGDVWDSKRRYVVRVLGKFRTPEEVLDQPLAIRNGAPVYVRDVADVRLGFKKPQGLVRRFGTNNIAVNCIRETGANVLDVMGHLNEATDDINENILQRRGLLLTQVYDETEYIYSAVDLVVQNIFIGGALTVAVLMAFLHLGVRTLLAIPLIIFTAIAAAYGSPWFFVVSLALIIGAGFWFARGALVVALAIPTSIIGTFLFLGGMDRSLNVISLAGLAFAVGMLVDNAVVVLENIYSRRSMGESAITAAVRGTQEVWGAVVASTLTTIAVFLPVLFVQEEAGQLFRDIALAISAAVGLSMVVSVTLIPTVSARLFGRVGKGLGAVGDSTRSEHTHPANSSSTNGEAHDTADRDVSGRPQERHGRLNDVVVKPINAIAASFINSVVWFNAVVQRSLIARLAVVFGLVGLSFGLSWLFWPKVEYLPTGNRNLTIGIILPSPGLNIDQLLAHGQVVEDELRPYWDIDEDNPPKDLDGPAIADFFFVVRGRSVFLGVRAVDPLRGGELVPLVQRVGSKLPGAIVVAQQTSLFERGLGAGRSIDVEITGPDIKKLVALGGQVIGQVAEVVPNSMARPIPSLDLSSPEMHIQPKLVQAAEMGLTASDIGFAANALVDGAYVGDYFLEGKKIDLTVIGESRYADYTQAIQALPIATPIGQLVPLSAVAYVDLGSGPEQINHRERERAITISVTPAAGTALETAMESIQDQIVQPMRDNGQLDGGYRINLSGTADKLRDTWIALRFNVMLALLITYLLMAALFESWLYPFVIILSVPLGAVGGILGLQFLNLFVLQPLDVLTMLGFVILIGTVVNNPILIVHQSLNHMREDGMAPRDAILASVRTRIRPIFMTTTTTVLGLAPLVLFPGAGSELYRGLGSVVLGGLVVSTLFTLLLVPTLFSLTLEAKQALVGLIWPSSASETAASASPIREPHMRHEPVGASRN